MERTTVAPDPALPLLTPVAVRAEPLRLTKSMTVGQVFQAIAINCLQQIQANAEGVRRQDAESVHQMRVGLRRLRSAFGLFKTLLTPAGPLRADLDWLTGLLGTARDWDILSGPILAQVSGAGEHTLHVDEVRTAALLRARLHYRAAAEAVGSPRYEQLIAALRLWIQNRGWRENDSGSQRKHLKGKATAFADRMLARRRRRLLKEGATLATANDLERHQVRIAAKKMRYTAEFFQSLYGSKEMAPLIAGLLDLQDTLGWLNDAATAGRLLRELRDQTPGIAESTGFIRGYLAARVQYEQRKIRPLWLRVQPLKLPARR